MKPPPTTTNHKIQLFIHTPHNDIISLNNIQQHAKIHDLKAQLEVRSGILAEIQNIYWSTIKLEDTKTFEEINMKSGTVLRIKLKERSLEQIYVNAIKGDVQAVFLLGVELIPEEEVIGNEDFVDAQSWNKFVPLRAFQALFAASFKGHLQLMSELLSKSAASLQMLSKNDRSCLHIAASQGNLHAVSFLLSQGIDADVLDKEGLSALAMAGANGHSQCEKRIWLYKWNLDVLNNLEQERQKQKENNLKELNEIAERYQRQYERSKREDLCLPPIGLIGLKNRVYKSLEIQNLHPDKATLPNLQAEKLKENNPRSSKQNISNLAYLKQHEKAEDHRRTKSVPQPKENEKSKAHKWNTRLNGWVEKTGNKLLKENFMKVIRLECEEKDSQEVLEKHAEIASKNEEKTEKKKYHRSLNKSNENLIKEDNKHLPWNRRAAHVNETVPTERIISPVQLLVNKDLQNNISHKRYIVLTPRAENVRRTKHNVRITKERPPIRFNAKASELPTFPRRVVEKSREERFPLTPNSLLEEPLQNIKASDNSSDIGRPDVSIDLEIRTPGDGCYSPFMEGKETTSVTKDKEENNVTHVITDDRLNRKYCSVTPTLIQETIRSEQDTQPEEFYSKDDTSAVKARGNEEIPQSKIEPYQETKKPEINSDNAEDEAPTIEVWRPRISVLLDRNEKETSSPNNAHIDKVENNYDTISSDACTCEKVSPTMLLQTTGRCPSSSAKSKYKSHEKWSKEKKQVKSPWLSRSSLIKVEHENQDEDKASKNRQAFERWLNKKSKTRSRSMTDQDTNFYKRLNRSNSENDLAYKKWLETKRKKCTETSSNRKYSKEKIPMKKGLTYEEWVEWKREESRKVREEIEKQNDNEMNRKQNLSGIPFEKWVEQKNEERKLNQENKRKEMFKEHQLKEEKQHSRWNNPHLKTFEEWSLEKLYDKKLLKKHNVLRAGKLKEKHFPEDSSLIFDMWLADKYFKEMENEKLKLDDVRRRGENHQLDVNSSDSDSDMTHNKTITSQNYKGFNKSRSDFKKVKTVERVPKHETTIVSGNSVELKVTASNSELKKGERTQERMSDDSHYEATSNSDSDDNNRESDEETANEKTSSSEGDDSTGDEDSSKETFLETKTLNKTSAKETLGIRHKVSDSTNHSDSETSHKETLNHAEMAKSEEISNTSDESDSSTNTHSRSSHAEKNTPESNKKELKPVEKTVDTIEKQAEGDAVYYHDEQTENDVDELSSDSSDESDDDNRDGIEVSEDGKEVVSVDTIDIIHPSNEESTSGSTDNLDDDSSDEENYQQHITPSPKYSGAAHEEGNDSGDSRNADEESDQTSQKALPKEDEQDQRSSTPNKSREEIFQIIDATTHHLPPSPTPTHDEPMSSSHQELFESDEEEILRQNDPIKEDILVSPDKNKESTDGSDDDGSNKAERLTNDRDMNITQTKGMRERHNVEVASTSSESDENDEETSQDDGEETSQNDGEENSKDDGEETSQDDGEETSQDDGEETSQGDGEETNQDDSEESNLEEGEEARKYDKEDSEESSGEEIENRHIADGVVETHVKKDDIESNGSELSDETSTDNNSTDSDGDSTE